MENFDLKTQLSAGIPDIYDASSSLVKNVLLNPVVVIIVTVVILLYLVLFSSIGTGEQIGEQIGEQPSTGRSVLDIILIAIFVILVLINAFAYFYNLNFTASIKSLFSPTKLDIKVKSSSDVSLNSVATAAPFSTTVSKANRLSYKQQVYHLPGNTYSYDNAKAVCKVYGGKLANISQIQAAYKQGADWCSLGWTDGQYVTYPTQTTKWNYLQTIKGQEYSCGMPGVNGTYVANKNTLYGANCYGVKPTINSNNAAYMKSTAIPPTTTNERNFNAKVNNWKNKKNSILIAPFNSSTWGML